MNHTGLSKSACSDQGHPLSAKQRVHSFVEYLGERERELHELAARQQRRLGQTLQLQQLEAECGQLLGFVASVEATLCSLLRLARDLDEAELARREHETFRASVERVAASVGGMQAKAQRLVADGKAPAPAQFEQLLASLSARWQRLLICVDNRTRLVMAQTNFYKDTDQVGSVFLKVFIFAMGRVWCIGFNWSSLVK